MHHWPNDMQHDYVNVYLLTADVIPPVFLSCPSDIRASLNFNSTATANWKIPAAQDNSNEDPIITVSPSGVTPPYTFHKDTVIVYTAKDARGNARNCSFKVLLEGGQKVISVHFSSYNLMNSDVSKGGKLPLSILQRLYRMLLDFCWAK